MELRAKHIRIREERGDLHLSAPAGALTPELRDEISTNKAVILAYLEDISRSIVGQPDPISPVARTDELPLSFGQERLWFVYQMEGRSASYNMPAAVRIDGLLDAYLFEQSLVAIINRHEVLRTCVAIRQGRAVQKVEEEMEFALPIVDLERMPKGQRMGEVSRLAQEEAEYPFDLTRAPLFRTTLVRLTPESHVLLWSAHHIIFDAWSMAILVREIAAVYAALAAERPNPLPPLPVQYVDFAVWQRARMSGGLLRDQVAYWKQQLAGVPAVLDILPHRPRPAVRTLRGAVLKFTLGGELADGLKRLSQSHGVTLFMTLLAGFAVLLSRYSGETDIVIGSPFANRNRLDLAGMIGFFVNTLPLRIRLTGNPTVRELLVRARQLVMEAHSHQDLPLEKIVEDLQPERNASYSPLLQMNFVLMNTEASSVESDGLRLTPMEVASDTAKFDVNLILQAEESRWNGTWEYNADLIDRETMEKFTEDFQRILGGMVQDPSAGVLTR